MDTLHKHSYSIESAMCSLVPSSGPVLCRDEMEEWSASEANLFEEALDKYGKDFNDIRNDFVSETLSTYRKRLYDTLQLPRAGFTELLFGFLSASLEDAQKHRRILLHVEDN
jgi:hypothetical protein